MHVLLGLVKPALKEIYQHTLAGRCSSSCSKMGAGLQGCAQPHTL